jgi:hypothetical protein
LCSKVVSILRDMVEWQTLWRKQWANFNQFMKILSILSRIRHAKTSIFMQKLCVFEIL